MYKKKSFLAIIPARGGSKRLPKKNILIMADKPLVSWSIEAALNSKYIDNVVLSSDNKEILSIGEGYSIEKLKRPNSLATDEASTSDTIKHVLDNQINYDYVILLQPTSPLRTSKHIDSAIEYLFEKNADAIVSVCEMEHSPLWSNILPHDKSMSGFLNKKIQGKRSQDLDKFYRLNGAIYICKTEKFLKEESLFLDDNIFAFEMSKKDSIDIDEYEDFLLCDIIIKERNEQKK